VGVVDGLAWDLLVPDAGMGSASNLLSATEVREIRCMGPSMAKLHQKEKH
jgi:hypothetical protein